MPAASWARNVRTSDSFSKTKPCRAMAAATKVIAARIAPMPTHAQLASRNRRTTMRKEWNMPSSRVTTMKSPPSRNPTAPPPSAAVCTSSAIPMTTNRTENTTIAVE